MQYSATRWLRLVLLLSHICMWKVTGSTNPSRAQQVDPRNEIKSPKSRSNTSKTMSDQAHSPFALNGDVLGTAAAMTPVKSTKPARKSVIRIYEPSESDETLLKI